MLFTFRNLTLPLFTSLCLIHTINQASASETENDLANSYAPLSYISARARLTGGDRIWSELYQNMGLNTGRGKLNGGHQIPGVYSDATLKHFLSELDRIQTEALTPINDLLVSAEEEIHQAFIHNFNARFQNKKEAANFFRSKEVLDWEKRNNAFLVDALQLSSLIRVIQVIAPDKYREPTYSDSKELELAYGGMVSPDYLILYHISTALNSDKLKPLIPVRFNIEKLRKEEMELRADAKKIFGSAAATKYQYLIEISLREVDSAVVALLDIVLQKQHNNTKQKLGLLATRAYYAENPYLTGVCDDVREQLDTNTIEKSAGNWERVRRADGTKIMPGSDEMRTLIKAYSRGCYVKKNAGIARNLLEKWAGANHDGGKKGAQSHCELAQWYRFGIGGPKNEATAARWENHYMVDSGGHSCGSYSPLPIDPTAPWRTIQ